METFNLLTSTEQENVTSRLELMISRLQDVCLTTGPTTVGSKFLKISNKKYFFSPRRKIFDHKTLILFG